MTGHHGAAEYLHAIRGGARTTSEVADAVGVTRHGAEYRLRRLRDEDIVEGELIGNTLVWSVADGAERSVARDPWSVEEACVASDWRPRRSVAR